ncbi:4-sulfomuconolactone hydrolase-like [Salvia divinorum]|uniref:4-sulfomuconolactone hydrolase-like n=1 Tax=Salvia divinorum TaxID=28513 RepID=A0ABD1I9G0_SALDI
MATPQIWVQLSLTAESCSTLFGFGYFRRNRVSVVSTSRRRPQMAAAPAAFSDPPKIIDSHLHVWASPQQAAEKYPYFLGQEPTLPGHVEFLLECMEQAGVDGALIVQPINHKFDHSYVTSVLKKYPSKFFGCCLVNPAEDGTASNSWNLSFPRMAFALCDSIHTCGHLMTNEVGKAMFAKAGKLGAPVGFMCMKGLDLHLSEIEELCTEFPSTVVLLDHLAFCKPPKNYEEQVFSKLLNLSRFPQVYVKLSALFRVSRCPYPYEDLSDIVTKVVSSYGANRIMLGSDFPYVVPECGYKEAKEAVWQLLQQARISSSESEWIMGRTANQIIFNHPSLSS